MDELLHDLVDNPILLFQNRPFHNFGASKSVARRSWKTSNSPPPISWSWGSEIVKGPARFYPTDHSAVLRSLQNRWSTLQNCAKLVGWRILRLQNFVTFFFTIFSGFKQLTTSLSRTFSGTPDRPSQNCIDSESRDWRISCCSGTSCAGCRGRKLWKGRSGRTVPFAWTGIGWKIIYFVGYWGLTSRIPSPRLAPMNWRQDMAQACFIQSAHNYCSWIDNDEGYPTDLFHNFHSPKKKTESDELCVVQKRRSIFIPTKALFLLKASFRGRLHEIKTKCPFSAPIFGPCIVNRSVLALKTGP